MPEIVKTVYMWQKRILRFGQGGGEVGFSIKAKYSRVTETSFSGTFFDGESNGGRPGHHEWAKAHPEDKQTQT